MNKIRKTLIGIASVATAGVSAIGIAPNSAQATGTGPITAHNNYGYPYASAPDCVETPGVTTGCVYDKWWVYQGQCVSWVAYRLNTLSDVPFNARGYKGIAHWGSATGWGTEAKSAGIPVNSTPARGAVAWYSHGHVAYVEHVNSNGTVVVSEMNYDDHNAFRVITISKSYRWPTAFIHFKDLPNNENVYFKNTSNALVRSTLPADNSTAAAANNTIAGTWTNMRLITQISDVSGDGNPDLLASDSKTGLMYLYKSRGSAGFFAPVVVGSGWNTVNSVANVGNMGDGKVSIAAVSAGGHVVRYTVNSTGITKANTLINSSSIKSVVGVGDLNSDGRKDFISVNTSGDAFTWYTTSTRGVSGGKTIGKPTTDLKAQFTAPLVSSNKIVIMNSNGTMVERHVSNTGFSGSTTLGTNLKPVQLG